MRKLHDRQDFSRERVTTSLRNNINSTSAALIKPPTNRDGGVQISGRLATATFASPPVPRAYRVSPRSRATVQITIPAIRIVITSITQSCNHLPTTSRRETGGRISTIEWGTTGDR